MKRFRTSLFLCILSTIVLTASACGTQNAKTASAGGGSLEANQKVQGAKSEEKVLRVGTSGRSLPMSYKNDKQQLDGFDIATIKEIGNRIGYKIEFTTAEFSGLFGMLDADKIDTIANQVEISEQRKQKYLFTTPYVYSGSQLVVKKGNDSVKSLDDMKGKKIAVGLGTNKEKFLRDYEKEKKIGMNVVTYEDPSGIVYDVANGRVDAYIVDKASGFIKMETSGLQLQFTGETFEDYIIGYPFVNNDKNKELVSKFNKAIEDMNNDGTMTRISMQHLRQDVSKKK